MTFAYTKTISRHKGVKKMAKKLWGVQVKDVCKTFMPMPKPMDRDSNTKYPEMCPKDKKWHWVMVGGQPYSTTSKAHAEAMMEELKIHPNETWMRFHDIKFKIALY